MPNFDYGVCVPANEEYDYLMDVAADDNSIVHWADMFSWVRKSKLITESIFVQVLRGFYSSRNYGSEPVSSRSGIAGFRPAFKPLFCNTVLNSIKDGDIITVGTLYMDDKPVKVPQNPIYDGDIESYIPGATLRFKSPLKDPDYQVQAIKCGDVLVCDRCLLKNISYIDIRPVPRLIY